MASAELDIVIPVYNEEKNILKVLACLERNVRAPFRVLICYDFEEDSTLAAIRGHWQGRAPVVYVRNRGRGAHAAVRAGFDASEAQCVLVWPADDDYNGSIVDAMVQLAQDGCDIVCASRFIPGGTMQGCPWLKAALVRTAAFTLYHLARVPTRDATNGLRLFSRRALSRIPIESTEGFTFSLELLAKVHRLGWKVGEVPARWFERSAGGSRFRVVRWIPAYLRWYLYCLATAVLGRGPGSVTQRETPSGTR